jgi:hypothetical protein
MDRCTVSNIKSIALFVVVTMAAVGLWNFHAGFTCARSKTKDSCVRKWFLSTACLLVLVLLATMYYTTRETTNTTNLTNTMNNTNTMNTNTPSNVSQDLA